MGPQLLAKRGGYRAYVIMAKALVKLKAGQEALCFGIMQWAKPEIFA